MMTVAQLRGILATHPDHCEVMVHIEGVLLCDDCAQVATGWLPVVSISIDHLKDIGNVIAIECDEN